MLELSIQACGMCDSWFRRYAGNVTKLGVVIPFFCSYFLRF